MKTLFLYLGTENLGIQTISSYLKSKGHEVELLMDPSVFSGSMVYENRLLAKLFDSRSDEVLKEAIARSSPDIIGFSVFTGNYIWALKWASICKEIFPLVPIVFGGIHPTSLPEEVIQHRSVDVVVIGEGEEAMEEILSSVNRDRIPPDIRNTVVKVNGTISKNPIRPYIRDLDAYPYLDKQLFYDKIPDLEECYLTVTSRGCPFRCTYCANNIFHNVYDFEKNHIRRRSVDNVIGELKRVKVRGRAKKIFFGDDVFIFNKKWLEEFAAKYKKEIGLPFWCTVYPSVVDEDIVRMLKHAGCWLVTMGVQSGSPRIRKNIFHRMETNDSILKASRLIKESGISLGIDNIFGAPSEKEEDLIESVELYQRIKPHRVHTFWLTYFPQTDILKYALAEGEITEKEIDMLKGGHVGQFDFGGSVKSNIGMYLKFEFLHHLLSLFGYNDAIKKFFLKRRYLLLANAAVNKILITLAAIKNRDTKFFYLIKSIFFKRNVP